MKYGWLSTWFTIWIMNIHKSCWLEIEVIIIPKSYQDSYLSNIDCMFNNFDDTINLLALISHTID